MNEVDPPDDKLPGRLLSVSMIFLLAAVGLRAASALNDGWALLYASIGCGAVALTCLGAAVWRSRARP
jgi:hypothetical protein